MTRDIKVGTFYGQDVIVQVEEHVFRSEGLTEEDWQKEFHAAIRSMKDIAVSDAQQDLVFKEVLKA